MAPRDAFATVEFEDPAGHMVEEVTVVGDGDDGALVLLQVALQPLDALGIEVVGRLVEEQDVRLLKQQTAEGHTTAFASREVAHGGVAIGTVEGIHGAFQLAVEFPSVVLLDEFGELALTGNQLVEVGVRFGKLIVDFFVFLKDVDDFLYAFFHHLTDGLIVVELWLLVEHADRIAGREHHFAVIGFLLASDDAQQGGFTCTLAP